MQQLAKQHTGEKKLYEWKSERERNNKVNNYTFFPSFVIIVIVHIRTRIIFIYYIENQLKRVQYLLRDRVRERECNKVNERHLKYNKEVANYLIKGYNWGLVLFVFMVLFLSEKAN
jgi:hypothetical protein